MVATQIHGFKSATRGSISNIENPAIWDALHLSEHLTHRKPLSNVTSMQPTILIQSRFRFFLVLVIPFEQDWPLKHNCDDIMQHSSLQKFKLSDWKTRFVLGRKGWMTFSVMSLNRTSFLIKQSMLHNPFPMLSERIDYDLSSFHVGSLPLDKLHLCSLLQSNSSQGRQRVSQNNSVGWNQHYRRCSLQES